MNYLKLKNVLPAAVFDELPLCIDKFKINTPKRLAHFLSQCAHESQNFTRTTENLNYSAPRLLSVFPKYFKDNPDMADSYARHPVAIASLVYADRMGNGDEESQEGWLYRGRGYIQLTGKDNYSKFDVSVPENIVANPDLVATKYPLLSAAWFWNDRKLNEIADLGETENEIGLVTKRVNGWYNGIEERTAYFNEYYALIEL